MTQIPTGEIGWFEPLLPLEPGLRAHVQRVAALVRFAAIRNGFSQPRISAVQQAGLLHHLQVEATGTPIPGRLWADLGLPPASSESARFVPAAAAAIVKAFREGGGEDSEIAESAALLDSANLFDEQMENLPYEDENTADAVNRLVSSGVLSPSFVWSLRGDATNAKLLVHAAISKLPVFPRAATEALSIARDPESGEREIERALSKDAVLAGEVIRMANSGAFGSDVPVNSLAAALRRVGTIAAEKLIGAAAVRACFVSAKLHDLWQHSFETAGNADWAAALSGLHSGEAYLAGLVHDVGRLPFELSGGALAIRRWEEAGIPAVYAEMLVAGTDHAEIGAEILDGWNFPGSIVEAVRFHHRPELVSSKLAALLYAVENSGESLPSLARDHAAAQRLEVEELPRARAVG